MLRRDTMNAATVSALAGAVGVVAGALVSSVGVVLRERLVGRREREAQEALRLQQLADQRAAFQRDTILGLQEAIGELWSQSADGYNQAARQQVRDCCVTRPRSHLLGVCGVLAGQMDHPRQDRVV